MTDLYIVRLAVRRRQQPGELEGQGFDLEVEAGAVGFAAALQRHFEAVALPMARHLDQAANAKAHETGNR